MKIKIAVLIIISFLFIEIKPIFSQEDYTLFKDIIPPAPTSSEFVKFGSIPVSYHTGMTNVSVPICNLEGLKTSIPISLDYHSGGVKLESIASWVGTNWSLNAGGVITRTVYGLPDELTGNGRSGFISSPPVPDVVYNGDGNFNYKCDVTHFRTIDSEPDVFNFNVLGYSGEFFFGQDGIAYQVPYQNLKIEPLNANANALFTAFKITTPDGMVFHFDYQDDNGIDAIEKTFVVNSCDTEQVPIEGITAWNLTKMYSVNAPEDVIYFYYSRNTVEYNLPETETAFLLVGNNNQTNACAPCGGAQEGCSPIQPSSCFSSLISETAKLSGISSDFYNLELIPDVGERQDLKNGIRLKTIRLKDKNNYTLKEFNLNYEYFISGTPSLSEYNKYRLMLKEVESSCTPPFFLEYYNNTLSFPERLSKSIDHWGYYNGILNNSLIPEMEYGGQIIGSANREPNFARAKIASLKKITYPTGGWTEFEYELNSYGFHSDESPIDPFTPELTTNSYTVLSDELNGSEEEITPFNITAENALGEFTVRFELNNTINDPDVLYARIEKIDPNSPTGVIILHNFYYVANQPVQELTLELGTGSYQLVAGALLAPASARLDADIIEYVVPDINDLPPVIAKPSGGVRIKKMTDYPKSDAPPIETSFNYTTVLEDGLTYSTGVAYHKPRYIGGVIRNIVPTGACNSGQNSCIYSNSTSNHCNYQTFVSSSNNPLFYKGGASVGYKEVVASRTGGGSTTLKYTTARDYGSPSGAFAPFVSRNWKRGLLTEKTETGPNGGVLSEINTYEFVEDDTYGSVNGLKLKLAWVHPYETPCGAVDHNHTYFYEFSKYKRVSPAVFLTNKTIIQDGVETSTAYTYNTGTMNVISSTFTNSDSKVYRTETDYAEEAANACLISRFIHNIPVETRHYVNNQLVGGSKTTFIQQGTICLPTAFTQLLHDGTELLRGTASYYTTPGPLNGLLKNYQQNFFAFSHGYEYFSTGPKSGLMEKRSYGGWQWIYDHHAQYRQLTSITDMNNIESTYTYDNCQRLTDITERNGQLSAGFGYNFNLAGDNGYNYIRSFSSAENITTFQYFDGLGRSIQNVNLEYSPANKDVAMNAIEYDQAGRPTRNYLPFLGEQAGAYTPPYGPFEVLSYEDSPLGRELARTFADGSSITTSYGTNGSNEVYNHQAFNHYPPATLYRKDVTDENGHTTTTFTDKAGRLILTRRYLNGQDVDTYNLYDDRGNLVKVLPPGGTTYEYSYDNRNRVETKSVPGAGTITYTYTDRDEVKTLTDAKGNHTIYDYDDYGRLETQTTNGNVVIANTYDTAPGAGIGQLASTSVAVLDGSGTMLNTTFVYDNIGRVYTSNAANHIGGSDAITNIYDGGTDRIKVLNRNHSGYENFSISEQFDFDHSKRLTDTWFQLNGGVNMRTANMNYDFKDRMITKNIGFDPVVGTYLQSVDYAYNIRNWLLQINQPNILEKLLPVGSCESLPEQLISECGDYVVDLETLLRIRLSEEELNVNCYDECKDYPIPTTTGSSFDTNLRTVINGQIDSVLQNAQLSEIAYPTQLSRVQFTDGREALLLKREMPLFYGDYNKLECIDINDQNQNIGIISKGFTRYESIGQLLETRKVETPTFEVPNICEEERCPFLIDYPPHRAALNNGASYFFNGLVYTNVLSNNNIENSFVEDGLFWNFSNYAEVVWDIHWDQQLPTGANITDVTVNLHQLGAEGKGVLIGLHDGTNFITINGGQQYLSFFGGVNSSELILTPDNLPSVTTLQNLQLVIDISGSTFGLDGLSVNIAYESTCDVGPIEPCYTPSPDCSPADQLAQMASLNQINGIAKNMTVNDLSLPTILLRIKLCNGAEVYLFEDEIGALQGDYIILHSIGISSTDQTFEIGTGAGDELDKYDLFAMRLYYGEQNDDQGNILTGESQFNGNIGNKQWQTRGRAIQSYGFSYDDLDRLTTAQYGEYQADETYTLSGKYGVQNISYDLRGNILTLDRNGLTSACDVSNNNAFGTIDQLIYSYNNQNQITGIVDAGDLEKGFQMLPGPPNYGYDDNGNMIRDPNKGITIEYNFLNLPKLITFDNGKTISFIYDAAGNKLRKITSTGEVTDYVGGIEYKNQVMESIMHSEGRIRPDYSGNSASGQIEYQYEYTIRDHLGNSRIMFADLNKDGRITIGGEHSEILQESHYYPFGMNMEGNWVPQIGIKNQYLYNGKELNEEFGLDWYNYGFRMYDPAIGRFPSVDPLAEEMQSYTPYHYTYNNPVRYLDLLGLMPYTYNWDTGKYEDKGGNGVNWNTVNNYIENNSGPKSFYVTSKNRIKSDGSTDWALEGVFQQAKGSFIGILQVDDSKDAYKQLKEYSDGGGTIGNIIFDSHGTYSSPSFKIGDQTITPRNYASGPVYLRSIGGLLNSSSEVCLLACHVGSPDNRGNRFISKVAQRMGVNVYGSQSWTGAKPGMFTGMVTPSAGTMFIENSSSRPNAIKNVGKWSKATPDGGVSTISGSLYINMFGGFSVGPNPYNVKNQGMGVGPMSQWGF